MGNRGFKKQSTPEPRSPILFQRIELMTPQQNIRFQDIPQDYSNLELWLSLHTDETATASVLTMTINDSGANYDSIRIIIYHSATLGTTEQIAQANNQSISAPAATVAAEGYSASRFFIPDYSHPNKYKAGAQYGQIPDQTSINSSFRFSGFTWRQKAPIKIIQLAAPASQNFTRFSSAAMYLYP